MHLTWHISIPDLSPLNITYDGTSTINVINVLDFNISTTLTMYRPDMYIESTIFLTLLKNVTMNGTLVECNIDPDLDSASIIMPVNTSGKQNILF